MIAGDIFEHQIGLALRGHAGVHQFSNVRVSEAGENAAFALETLLAGAAKKADVQELDGDLPFEKAVTALLPARHCPCRRGRPPSASRTVQRLDLDTAARPGMAGTASQENLPQPPARARAGASPVAAQAGFFGTQR